ncbi:PREDICTED: uncharacterized protein LOC104703763 isoform X1 [Camelina sativa]|uniref:Uncharacterized protein LOC104703763 isoform X1 n=1 Tax=Camelina sativa TaxID=90675 RepID=A0ABM0SYW8_CAMSA|nr:PREDICTED: uncharacterized protein LOC104703763 isoform X1 [Camelina sativa]
MLEKIGLPPKPSLRGNSWVVDASHCQGCSSQFTFINRKHHCRRCGGLFCGSCTQQRMSLRGQGDSPVRICEPCKKLEEAARFELRHGYKNRAAKAGSSKRNSKNEDDVLSEILGSDVDVSSSSESVSSTDRIVSKEMGSSSKDMELDAVSASPEDLRKQAVEEKNKYRVLKGEGKSDEALKAFKRGRELERQADALEISIRRNRKRALSMQNVSETKNKAATKESSKSQKPPRQGGKGNDDLAADMRELGWSDDEEKKPAAVSLEGEFSSLLREIPLRANPQKSGGIDKSQVIALKKKALALKREGKLTEAKEELKRAKILERELEEQELLGGADESDDELSALINSMDDDKEDDLLAQYDGGSHDFDISNLVGNVDDIGVHGEYDVTDEDMEDPAIAAALKSLGWSEDPGHRENVHTTKNRDEILADIQTLKREALNLKRAGNVAEAMASLKKAKLLEKELEAADTPSRTVESTGTERDTSPKIPPRSRLAIQKELLAVKKKALTLRREGKFNEAEEELKKGAVLQNQFDELDNSSKLAAVGKATREKGNLGNDLPDINSLDDDGEVDVKDEELNDPSYLSMLKNLGWNEEDNNPAGSSSEKSDPVSSLPGKTTETLGAYEVRVTKPRRSKAEIQRELLGLKRKALTLRRQGNVDEAEEVLSQTKILEAQIVEIDSGKNLYADNDQLKKQSSDIAAASGINEGDDSVTENDMKDPALLSTLKNLGWEDEEPQKSEAALSSMQSTGPRIAAKSKGQIQRELLDLKRKALAFKRQGKIGEADELYSKASVLQAQLAELETPMMETKGSASAKNPENYMDVDLLVGLQMEDKAVKSASVSHTAQDSYDLLGDFISPAKSGSSNVVSQPGQQQPSMMDLLTGEHSERSEIHAEKGNAETKSDFGSGNNQGTVQRVAREESKPSNIQSAAVQNTSPQSNLKQEILAHKIKALAFKKEGNMSEAKKELQQAKLLERRLQEGEDPSPEKMGRDNMVSTTQDPPAREKENSPSSSAPKAMSSRDRFKLQQESLSHKRQAMKLRREGKMQEAEAEFEIAKTLEAQLEDSTSSKPEPVDDVAVEDFLDPQLLSALKAIGLDNPINPPSVSKSGTTQAAVKPNPVKESNNSNNNQERSQLVERIKAEKVKAVTLKREGKQAEALDALRRAKLYEKKLNALA